MRQALFVEKICLFDTSTLPGYNIANGGVDMRLMCPRCGQEVTVGDHVGFACEGCGGWLQVVPHGKAFLLKAVARELPGEKEALRFVDQAAQITDPVKKKKLLDQAEQLCPDSLAVQREKLYLGRLWQRDLKNIDYHLIKCYLLHVFEAPETEAPAMRESMLQELTADPQLLRCLDIAPDREAFITEYVQWICREYVKVFLKGSTSHNGRFMGIQVTKIEKALAMPTAKMLYNMSKMNLPAPYDTLLPRTLVETFVRDVGPDAFLRQAMKELGL